MNKQIHRSRDYTKFLKDVIENELNSKPSSNEKLWVKMGSELEIQGTEKTQISTIMRRDIEDMLYEKEFSQFMEREEYKWHNGRYWLVTKKQGWTNPEMARHVTFDPDEDQGDGSINTPNSDMIDILKYIKNICNLGIEKAKELQDPKTKEPLNFEDIYGKKQTREFYKQMRTIISNCKYAYDDKTKVPRNTEQVLLECLATATGSLNYGAREFMKIRVILMEEQGKFLTVKQATRFRKGERQSQLPLLKPLSRNQAIFADCSGMQCTCGSWRVREKTNNSRVVECFDCDKVFPATSVPKCKYCQIPLYSERLKWMVKHGNRCQSCKTENDLPQEIVDLVKA